MITEASDAGGDCFRLFHRRDPSTLAATPERRTGGMGKCLLSRLRAFSSLRLSVSSAIFTQYSTRARIVSASPLSRFTISPALLGSMSSTT